MTRLLNPLGMAMIREYEGFRTEAYQDSGGVWTCGYGHVDGVKQGDTCDAAQAQAWLDQDLTVAEDAVSDLVSVALSENQFAALVLFVFNVGRAAFAKSTLLKQLNQGNYSAVPKYLSAWIFDAGRVQRGLVARRAAEAELWRLPS